MYFAIIREFLRASLPRYHDMVPFQCLDKDNRDHRCVDYKVRNIMGDLPGGAILVKMYRQSETDYIER